MSTIPKTGGAASPSTAGALGDEVIALDPNEWVTTLFRGLKDYILKNTDADIYNVIGNFPPTELFTNRQPFDKTIIHFEYDDIRNPTFGFGDNVVDSIYDDTAKTVIPIEAKIHIANFDVGIWASERSGGDTARMLAYQKLNDLFTGTLAYRSLRDSRGIEIVSFDGGNFIQEDIDDITVWRVSGATLVVRVFSRTSPPEPIPYIDYDTITQEPSLEIQPSDPIVDE